MIGKFDVKTYYNTMGHMYYTLGRSPIMYDICYPVGEAITNDTMGLGALHCQKCFDDASIKNIVVGTCMDCTYYSKTTWKCSCTQKYGFYNAFEYTNGCKDTFCVIRYYLSHVDYSCMGHPNYMVEFFNYHTYKDKVYISKHKYFDIEDQSKVSQKMLSLMHPDTIDTNTTTSTSTLSF
jgi:hypothetical protein